MLGLRDGRDDPICLFGFWCMQVESQVSKRKLKDPSLYTGVVVKVHGQTTFVNTKLTSYHSFQAWGIPEGKGRCGYCEDRRCHHDCWAILFHHLPTNSFFGVPHQGLFLSKHLEFTYGLCFVCWHNLLCGPPLQYFGAHTTGTTLDFTCVSQRAVTQPTFGLQAGQPTTGSPATPLPVPTESAGSPTVVDSESDCELRVAKKRRTRRLDSEDPLGPPVTIFSSPVSVASSRDVDSYERIQCGIGKQETEKKDKVAGAPGMAGNCVGGKENTNPSVPPTEPFVENVQETQKDSSAEKPWEAKHTRDDVNMSTPKASHRGKGDREGILKTPNSRSPHLEYQTIVEDQREPGNLGTTQRTLFQESTQEVMYNLGADSDNAVRRNFRGRYTLKQPAKCSRNGILRSK